jgi:dipeptidyl aminopeptidase/acylaminoacyl peptidase
VTMHEAPGDLLLRTEWAESFAITGSGLAVVSWRTADGPRLHTVIQGAAPEPANQLPSTDQLSPVAHGEQVAFWARMPGAAGRLVLFAADIAAGTLTELPVRGPLRPHVVAWSGDGHLITSQRTAAGGTLVRVAADGSTPPEALWQLPSGQRWLDPVPDVGPDGRILLTVRSGVSQDLLLLDPAAGTVTPLVEGNRSAAPVQARWSPDGQQVLVLVRRRRAMQARLIDLAAGVIEALDLPAPSELPTWNGDGTLLAFASADWPWTRLLVYEMASRQIAAVPLPAGACGESHRWHGDDCYFLAFGPDLPPTLHRWRPGEERATPVTPPAPLPQRTSPAVLRLATPEGFELPALAHEPAGQVRGTVLELHGGPSSHWRISWNPVLLAMTAAGYRVVLAETRGTTFSAWPIPPMPVTAHGVQEVVDVGYCIDELVRRGLAEPGRIVLAGHSHGAFVAYRASLACPGVAGVIMTSGYLHPSTLAGSADPEVRRFTATAYPASQAQDGAGGGTDAQGGGTDGPGGGTDGALPAACPVLAVHGERDTQVPAAAAAAMFARLAGDGHRWLLLPGEEHGFRQRRNAARYVDAAIEFLGQVVKADVRIH